MHTLTITAKGQVTFRQSLLKHLGVRPGDPIEVEQMPDGQLAVRAAHSGEWDQFFGCLQNANEPVISIEVMNDAISEGWAGTS